MDFGTLTLYRRGEQPQPFRLRLGSLSIGNDPSADISIDDSLLERFHARVVCTPAGCQLTDLGSKSGTVVNKERLSAHAPRLLRDGDRVLIGRVGLLYQAPASAAQAPARGTPTPAQGEARPASGEARPASGEEKPVSGEAQPASGEARPASGEARPASGEAQPASGEEKPVRGEAQPASGEARPASGEARPASGEEKPVRGEARPASGEARPAQAVATRPERAAPAAVVPADDWNVMFQVPIAPVDGQGATLLPGNRRRRPRHDERELPYEAEDYLALLPPIYHDDRFMRQFLLIFKSSLDPLDRQVAQIHHYFDPRTAPEHLLPWLAGWVDLVLDERWPEARRRELIGAASVLYRWRGTRRGLSDYLRIYTGVTPRIVEQGQERRGEPPVPPHTFRVIIEAPALEGVDRALVERIIEIEKPAHAAYQLEIRTA